jgi:hypothetical protein
MQVGNWAARGRLGQTWPEIRQPSCPSSLSKIKLMARASCQSTTHQMAKLKFAERGFFLIAPLCGQGAARGEAAPFIFSPITSPLGSPCSGSYGTNKGARRATAAQHAVMASPATSEIKPVTLEGRLVQSHFLSHLPQLLCGGEVSQAQQGRVTRNQKSATEHDEAHPRQCRDHSQDTFQEQRQ